MVIPPPPTELLARIRALPNGETLLDRLADETTPVYLVGGAVRDLLLQRTPPELDLIVEGDVTPVAERLGGRIRSHGRFGTARATVDGQTFDLARARRERYARPGALPDVEPADLGEDLTRRDFTVNTGAVALTGPEPGRLVTADNMLEDLGAGRLRVLHDASFIDDPTRLLRLARYVGRLGFTVEPHTRSLARQAIDGGALGTLTGARIGAELRLLAREPDPLAAFAALHALRLDQPLGLDASEPTLQHAEHALTLLGPDERADRLVLAAVLAGRAAHDAPGAIRAQLDAWGFESADREAIMAAATRQDEVASALAAAAWPSEIAAAAGHAPAELIALAGASGAEAAARQWLQRLRHVRLEINGDDLLAAGVPRGAAIGRGLRAALREKLDHDLDGREEELRVALRSAEPSQ